jgi:hypothetical protein
MRFGGLIAGVVLLTVALGCATWDVPAPQTELTLPIPAAGADSVVIETAFVRWRTEPLDAAQELWRALDEQFLPPNLRQQLAANGLRVGIISDPVPESIRKALDATSDPLSIISDLKATPGAEVLTRRERRQCPSGSHEEIEVLPLRAGRRVVLFNDSGRVRAEQFEKPRGVFHYSLHSLGDGRVRAELRPVIDYGEPRQEIIGGQNAYRFDVRRAQQVCDQLAVSATLAAGQTLVVTATPENKGLGALFFAGRFDSEQDQLLLLLRIAEARHDELFSPRRQRDSLVTPLK